MLVNVGFTEEEISEIETGIATLVLEEKKKNKTDDKRVEFLKNIIRKTTNAKILAKIKK